jgi:hypothetical protein
MVNMDNVSQYLQMMDLAGQNPGMQNIGAQQGLQQQNMGAMNTLAQQALTNQSANPMQSMANALRAQQKPGLAVGQMRDNQGNIVPDPTYGNNSAYSNMMPSEIANMQQNGI